MTKKNFQFSRDFFMSFLSRDCCETSASLVSSTPRSRSSMRWLCGTWSEERHRSVEGAAGERVPREGTPALGGWVHLVHQFAMDLISHSM